MTQVNIEPLVFTLQNTSDDKLYDVPLLFKDAIIEERLRGYVKIESSMREKTYKDLMDELFNLENYRISIMYIMPSCDYKKFQTKQGICPITLTGFKENTKEIVYPMADPYQYQESIIAVKFKEQDNLVSKDSQLTLQYLMPETSVRFYLFFEQKSNQ